MEVIGIIEVRSAGTFVTQVNVGNIMTTIAPLFMLTSNTEQDLLEFRRLLETEAVRLAAAKQIQPAITRLQEAVALMRQSMLQDNPKTGVEADVLFHKAIFRNIIRAASAYPGNDPAGGRGAGLYGNGRPSAICQAIPGRTGLI